MWGYFVQDNIVEQLLLCLKAFDESLSQVPQQTTIEELQKSWDTARSDYAVIKFTQTLLSSNYGKLNYIFLTIIEIFFFR